jgi:serine protease Do
MRLLSSLFMGSALVLAQQSTELVEPQPTDALQGLSTSIEHLSRRVGWGVVQIVSTGYALSREPGDGGNGDVMRQSAIGSGVVLSADGYIVTNAHLILRARYVRVRLTVDKVGTSTLPAEDRLLEARVVGIDRDSDLAVLKVEKGDMNYLTLGDSDSLRQGQLVLAFGNPLGLQNSVTMGVVSSTARELKLDDAMIYIQTDAPINPGNSGGPLIDVNGRVVGINTVIVSQSGGSESLGFAIPSNIVKTVYTQIRAEGRVHRTEIGVSVQTITPLLATALRLRQDSGVVLSDVEPNEPAEQAGLQVGDIVLSLNGRMLGNARQFEVDLYRRKIGDTVTLEIQRGGSTLTYSVPVIPREDDPHRFADMVDPVKTLVPKLGILGLDVNKKVADMLPPLRRKYGVVVAASTGNAPYNGDSLELGDVIYSVNGQPVANVDALRRVLDTLNDGDPLAVQVQREGTLRYLTLTME